MTTDPIEEFDAELETQAEQDRKKTEMLQRKIDDAKSKAGNSPRSRATARS